MKKPKRFFKKAILLLILSLQNSTSSVGSGQSFFLATDSEVPGSIPGATRYFE
jgi:hypothetical protein